MTPQEQRQLLSKINKLARNLGKAQPKSSPHNHTYWPYQVHLDHSKIKDAERFCYANFKSSNWRNNGQFFGFKRKEDWTWFKLRFQ